MEKYINNIKVVNDSNEALEYLKRGETVARYESGDSMRPILNNNEYAILEPVKNLNDVKVGDAVFCLVNGVLMTHMVWLISESSYFCKQFLIGSSSGYLYGWTTWIYAKAKGTNRFEGNDNI